MWGEPDPAHGSREGLRRTPPAGRGQECSYPPHLTGHQRLRGMALAGRALGAVGCCAVSARSSGVTCPIEGDHRTMARICFLRSAPAACIVPSTAKRTPHGSPQAPLRIAAGSATRRTSGFSIPYQDSPSRPLYGLLDAFLAAPD